MNLFSTEKHLYQLPNATLEYYPNFFLRDKANQLLKHLEAEIEWRQDDITVFGKTYKQPRLTALYGESNKSYGYSSIVMKPLPFTKELVSIKTKVEEFADHSFNVVLLNLYRDGNDSNGWHADNEKVLGNNPVIASVSFGEERPFHFKHRTLVHERHKVILQHGSLLIMKGEMQKYWIHQIAKTQKSIGKRINLTFRTVLDI